MLLLVYEFIFWLGFFGAFIQLLAYVLNLWGKLNATSLYYIGANAFGCCFTVYYAWITNDIPFLMLEITWGTAAFIKIFETLRKKSKKKE